MQYFLTRGSDELPFYLSIVEGKKFHFSNEDYPLQKIILNEKKDYAKFSFTQNFEVSILDIDNFDSFFISIKDSEVDFYLTKFKINLSENSFTLNDLIDIHNSIYHHEDLIISISNFDGFINIKFYVSTVNNSFRQLVENTNQAINILQNKVFTLNANDYKSEHITSLNGNGCLYLDGELVNISDYDTKYIINYSFRVFLGYGSYNVFYEVQKGNSVLYVPENELIRFNNG